MSLERYFACDVKEKFQITFPGNNCGCPGRRRLKYFHVADSNKKNLISC
jgi:hypothetical protein